MKQFKISDDEIKRLYLSGHSLREIAAAVQDTKGLMPLRRRLQSLGVCTKIDWSRYADRNEHRTFELDEHVFDSIDSPEKAYWLGFLYADGYNNEKRHRIEIALQPQDKGHLDKFRMFIKSEVLVREYTSNGYTKAVFGITSKHLSCTLASLGCVKAKTRVRRYPDIQAKFNKDFIRGYFDGNGCFSHTKPNQEYWQVNFNGNRELIEAIELILEAEIGINHRKPYQKKNTHTVSINYSGKHVCEKILSYMYNGATVFLDRKYDKYRKLYLGGEIRNNNKPREIMETPNSYAADNHEPSPVNREGATTIPKGSTLKRVEVRGSKKLDDDIV